MALGQRRDKKFVELEGTKGCPNDGLGNDVGLMVHFGMRMFIFWMEIEDEG